MYDLQIEVQFYFKVFIQTPFYEITFIQINTIKKRYLSPSFLFNHINLYCPTNGTHYCVSTHVHDHYFKHYFNYKESSILI